MKALYHGGLRIDPDESCTICVKVARYNPQSKNNHQKLPENANDKAAFPLPAIQQTSNRSKNVRKVPRQFCLFFKVENILKGRLDTIPSPSPSVKIQIMGSKLCLRCKGKTLLGVVNILLKSNEFSQKVKEMGSNPGYLLKSFLLYFL